MAKQKYDFPFDTSGKKFTCPSCGHKRFVRFKDVLTDAYVSSEVGKCDRENNCEYSLFPWEWEGFEEYKKNRVVISSNKIEEEIRPMEFIPLPLLEKSMVRYDKSNFAKYLVSIFGHDIASAQLQKYFVGYSDTPRTASCVFWRIDINGKLRTGKKMLYDPITGKRNKDWYGWVHKEITGFHKHEYQNCFFGEHLLADYPDLPIAIVESEKTAMIMSVYSPEVIWIATGGKTGIKWKDHEVHKVLQNRNVTLFPDFGRNAKTGKTCYDEWKEMGEIISKSIPCHINVSRILEDEFNEYERCEDYDLADIYLDK